MGRAAVLGVVLALALAGSAHAAAPRVKVSLRTVDATKILKRGALSVTVGVPRRTPAAQDQKSQHMRLDGSITDHCAGGPCHSVP